MPTIRILAFVMLNIATVPISAQLIVAHRGASYDAPENTIAAFRLAWRQEADAVEGDFYVTKDQHIVCIHDESTKRVSPSHTELHVAKSTLAELRSLDVGKWKDPKFQGERIPTFKEVLQTIPNGKLIFVEIKCGPEILPILKRQLTDSKLEPHQVTILCFNKDVVSQAREMMPQYKSNWLTAYDQDGNDGDWRPSRENVITTLKRSGATGLGTQANFDVLNRSFVKEVRTLRKEFHVWTVNEMADARSLQVLGVDSITTDRPAFIREALQLEAIASPAGAD